MDEKKSTGSASSSSSSSFGVYNPVNVQHVNSDPTDNTTDCENDISGSKSEDSEEPMDEDQELMAIKVRFREMEEEARKLAQIQNEVDLQMNADSTHMTIEERMEVDSRSVYVGNVDYAATAVDVELHFHGCGHINRVTILCNKAGHPKGFAYIEFAEADCVKSATMMDDSLFRGRQIKVLPKRTNIHGMSRTDRPPRGLGISRMSRGSFRARSTFGYRGRFSRGNRRARGMYYSPY